MPWRLAADSDPARSGTKCSFPTFTAYLTHCFKPFPHAYRGCNGPA